MARANLKDLPEELVSNISLRLWSDDVQALRLTCKALESKTLHEWATEYFSEKAFIISSDSLKVLLNIANSSKLRPYLRHIHILTAYFSDSAFACGKVCPYGHCNGWQPTIRQREAWNFLCQDQKQLKDSGKDKEMLTEAFKKLSALEGISMVDTTSSIHISTDIRQLRKVARLCGRNFQTPNDHKTDSEYLKVLSHVWSTLTTAIASSGITTLTRFGTILGKGGNSLCVPLDIRFSDAKIDRLKSSFKSLEKFRAQLTVRTPRHASGGQLGPMSKARVQKFASTLPALQNLSLDFDSEPTDNTIFTTFMKQLDFGKLTSLSFNTLATDRKSLMAVFERLGSIQELFMTFADLSRGSWIPVLKQLQGMSDHLDHLHLMYLSEAGRKAYFLAQPDEDEQMDPEGAFDDFMMGGPEDEFDEDEDTDKELPPLETMDGDIVDGGADPLPSTTSLPATVEDDNEPPTLASSSTQHAGTASTPAHSFPATSAVQSSDSKASKPGSPGHYSNPDHKAPGQESFPERGYYVCLRGKEEINKQLTNFCLEYNVGDEIGAGAPPIMGGVMGGGLMGGMTIPVPANGPPGQPPNVNNILNGLAGYFGLPPMPGQNGGADGGGGGAGQGGAQAGGANNNNANANNGNAAGGQSSTANTTNQANTTPNNNAQAAAGAALGPAHGPQLPPHAAGMIPADLADFIMGGPPPAGVMGHGGSLDDGWDTDYESENASGSDQ